MGFCNCSMFCCALFFVRSSFANISMGKIEMVALLCLSACCLVIVVWLFLTMPRVCLQFVIVVFPDHTHLLFYLVNWCYIYMRMHTIKWEMQVICITLIYHLYI